MIQIIVFALLSIGVIYVSRRSLLTPGSHGFYRFFAWEAMAALFALNMPVWFETPWSWNQLISWFLLIACLLPLTLGARTLTGRGNVTAERSGEPQLMAFEKTSALVTTGIYHYIRHPLYSSLLVLTWGIFFKDPGPAGICLAAAASLLLVATARADEAECIRFFGNEYRAYREHTRMFVPFLF